MCIAYFQPITRGELGQFFGEEVSRDTIGHLRALGFIAAGPRSPQPGAPYFGKGFLRSLAYTSEGRETASSCGVEPLGRAARPVFPLLLASPCRPTRHS